MEAGGTAERSSPRRPRQKMPDEQLRGSFLVGSIVEKGFSSSPKSGTVVSLPRPSVLPFPVARHRAHGPHWSPTAPTTGGDEDDDDEDIDNLDYGFAAPLAQPMNKKGKPCLDLSRWKELIDGKHSTSSCKVIPKQVSGITSKSTDNEMGEAEKAWAEAAESRLKRKDTTGIFSPSARTSVSRIESRKLRVESTTDSSEIEETEKGKIEFRSVGQSAAMDVDQEGSLDSKAHRRGQLSTMEDIDRENLFRLSQMSTQEIEHAQAEIKEKMDSRIIEMLRKRGQDRIGTRKAESAEVKGQTNLNDDNLVERSKSSYQVETSKFKRSGPPQRGVDRNSGTSTRTQNMDYSAISGEWEPSGVSDSGLWDTWCLRVEKVRDLRFKLDGNFISVDTPMEIENGASTNLSHYTPKNVAERDFLRTEGDPGAAGYTLKEAIALSRSIIPSQRCFALQLLGSVLNKCMHNLPKKDGEFDTINASHSHGDVDWQAIWAYLLGPELEIALSLRMSLDDNHNSVILASAKVLQSILSFDGNEFYFNLSEKLCLYETDVYTAPIFRSRPDINFGYLHGGFWKYSSKPSNILPFNDQKEDFDDEEGRTIQEDVVVAGQDMAGSLVRMGILPRICYLLEVEPTPSLDECIVSVLIALARHSPSCASTIMKCPRLIETVIHRFTKQHSADIYPSTIKSVVLLRVLSQVDRQNCSEFVKRGFFQDIMWHLYRGPISLDQWIKCGKERCALTSSLMVEQLRFWKVCIRYGYCASYFEDFFPFMSIWLNLPTLEKLAEDDVLEEFALVSREVYHVLEALSHLLPGLHSEVQLKREASEVPVDVESWSWSRVVPMVDLASKWLSLRTNSIMPFVLRQDENSGGSGRNSSARCIIWVISAVMHMLASIFDKVNTEGTSNLPWLPVFVPMVGLEIVKNGFFDFAHTKGRREGGPGENISFISLLSKLRAHYMLETALSSVSCLHGLIQLVNSVDKCIQSARVLSRSSQLPRADDLASTDGDILEEGIGKRALTDLERVLSSFMTSFSSEWQSAQKIEVFGRGGPAPGIGLGWGSSGGGYWSSRHLLSKADAHLILRLLRIFPTKDLTCPTVTNDPLQMMFTRQRINAILGICLVSGPRDRHVVEKALDSLLQPPILEFMGSSMNGFIQTCVGMKSFRQQYCHEDYRLFCDMLNVHFRSFWLWSKSKSKSSSEKDSSSAKSGALDMIPEDTEMLETQGKYANACSLQVEWAYQRLPLPLHWFMSPLLCITTSRDTSKPGSSDDSLDIAKSGLFFLLGLEAISYHKNSSNYETPVLAVPLIWKLHALSVVLLVRTETADVLEDDKSRDNYECLQEFYGQQLDQLRLQNGRSTQEGKQNAEVSSEFLMFQSQVHGSYATFIENLVEQFGAVSYGNVFYGRQIALYLHRSVEAAVRLAAWNSLSSSHVLELLPPLDKSIGKAKGYLEPIEENEGILEAYAKTLVSGSLDRAASRGAITFTIPMHHLSCFIFKANSERMPFKNKLVKLLLRGYSRRPQLKEMLLNLIRYIPEGEVSPSLESETMRRFDILSLACQGNTSLLSESEKLKAALNMPL